MGELIVHETFECNELNPRLRWIHEPKAWRIDPSAKLLRVEPAGNTDYWQKTHYGFQADNGPFLAADVPGDWVLTTHVRFHPAHQYDQAGVMIHITPTCWIKSAVEYQLDRPSMLGAVVTNAGYSDWSTQDFVSTQNEVWFRLRREDTDYIVDASTNGNDWNQIRMAHLLEDVPRVPVRCGLYACSPKEGGFVAEFLQLRIESGRI